MEFLNILKQELVDFFSIQGILDLVASGDYQRLASWDGLTTALAPLIPVVVIVEMLLALTHRKFSSAGYRMPFFIYAFNRVAGRFISIGVTAYCIGTFQPLAPFQVPLAWYGFLYGYMAWELSHFVYHYLAHNVRILWCLHATHHAPEQMNLSVNYAHFILEAPYADFVRTSICMLLGVSPVMLFAIMFIDGTWGGFIHVGERLLKNASLGSLGNWILTPAHHRVHHARNPLYLDTNFCNLLNIWDRLFKTYQPEQPHLAIDYGVTRPINLRNFWDVYFGEFYFLLRDIVQAPGLLNKLKYIVMPPGWHHTGHHKTARAIRRHYLNSSPQTFPNP